MANTFQSVREIDFTVPQTVFPSPRDWRDQFIYFLLVDRFDNNQPDIPPYVAGVSARGRDPGQGAIFQGGNLAGIIRRLDYLKSLGCTAIWLSPVLKNRQESADSYHGYGIQSFLDVDPRFGTREDLRELVRQAHLRGMYVILDIIINHTGDNWAYPGGYSYYYWKEASGPFDFGFWRQTDPAAGLQDDDGCWPKELQRIDAYKRRGEIRNWSDSEEAVNGDFLSLKELDIRNAQVLDTLITVYKYWIAAADIDGFRVDTVKHMEDSATAVFCNAVREYALSIGKDNFFIFGEVVGDDATLQRYIGRNSRIPGTNERFPSLDACLDFPLYFMLEEVMKGFRNPSELRTRYEWLKTNYSDHGAAGQYFVTFVDNHDQMSRPYRRFMYNNPFPQQAVLAIGYLLTSQGIPCIYYGTEQGFDGGGDNDRYVRECMFGGKWGPFDSYGAHCFNERHEIYQGISRIAQVRAQERTLRYGRQYFREISGNGVDFGVPFDGQTTLAYSRILDTDEIVIVMNLSVEPRYDAVTVDCHLSAPGSELVDLLNPAETVIVAESAGRSFIRCWLDAHRIAIYKKKR